MGSSDEGIETAGEPQRRRLKRRRRAFWKRRRFWITAIAIAFAIFLVLWLISSLGSHRAEMDTPP